VEGRRTRNRSSNAAHFPGVCDCSLMCGHAGTTGHLRTPTNGPAEHDGDMDLGLAERTALVCASTSGLGLATARALCEDGARVVVTSRSSDRAEEVAAALPNAIGTVADLLAADGAARLFGESTKRVGKIDILVLNGPGPAPRTAADVDDAGVDSAVAALVKPRATGAMGSPTRAKFVPVRRTMSTIGIGSPSTRSGPTAGGIFQSKGSPKRPTGTSSNAGLGITASTSSRVWPPRSRPLRSSNGHGQKVMRTLST